MDYAIDTLEVPVSIALSPPLLQLCRLLFFWLADIHGDIGGVCKDTCTRNIEWLLARTR